MLSNGGYQSHASQIERHCSSLHPRKTGKVQLYAHYRMSRAINFQGSCPIAHSNETVDTLSDATTFSTFDASSWDWKLEVAD